MNDLLITPDRARKVIQAADIARGQRDKSIAAMRKGNPKYWTYERLAKHWHLTKPRIQKILEKEGVE